MEVVESSFPSLNSVTNCIEDLLEGHSELVNTRPTSLLPKEVDSHMDKLLHSQDPDVMEAKKFFMSLFDPDSLKLNTSLILLVTKACGFQITPNHQLLCEVMQNYILGHVLHVAILNVKQYTPPSLLCNKVSTLIGDDCFSIATKKAAEMRVCAVYDKAALAFTQSIESKFVKLEDVDSWITKYSQEYAMDGCSLKSAVLLSDDKKKEEAEAAAEFGINFALIRCIKKELQEFQQNKENNDIFRDSLPVLHAFAGQEKEIHTTPNLLKEVVKMKGVEKTIAQMKDLQEKALKNLHFFATDTDICQVLKNLVTVYVDNNIQSFEGEKGMNYEYVFLMLICVLFL